MNIDAQIEALEECKKGNHSKEPIVFLPGLEHCVNCKQIFKVKKKDE